MAASYVILWCIVVPFVDSVVEYGKLFSRHGEGLEMQSFPIAYQLAPVEEKMAEMDSVQRVRKELRRRRKHYEKRMEILEDIVPEWFHRNDIIRATPTPTAEPTTTPTTEPPQDLGKQATASEAPKEKPLSTKAPPAKEKKSQPHIQIPKVDMHQQKSEIDPERPDEKATLKPADAVKQEHDKDTKDSATDQTKHLGERGGGGASTTNDGQRQQRTLETMDELTIPSKCPTDPPSELKTTLVVQCSLDRMFILKETCSRWRDPIIVSVHLPSSEAETTFDEWTSACPNMTILPFVASAKEKEWSYPVNELRNMALDAVQTSHIFVVDVDFVPSMNLDEAIHHVLVDREAQRSASRHLIPDATRDAIVVPAFERKGDCEKNGQGCGHLQIQQNASFLPRTFEELQYCVGSDECGVFQATNNWEGHWSTRSKRWLSKGWYEQDEIRFANGTFTHPIKRIQCFGSLRYEPYVVIRWCPSDTSGQPVAPYYDERFYGYGKNKIEMISHLRFLGYQFSILPKGFIVHNPHPESVAKRTWNDVDDYKLHEKMDNLYPEFLKELIVKYRDITDANDIVKQCEKLVDLGDDDDDDAQDEEHSGSSHAERVGSAQDVIHQE